VVNSNHLEWLSAAIERVQDSRQSHVEWAEHLRSCPDCPHAANVQTAEEQDRLVAEYDNVLACLDSLAALRAERDGAIDRLCDGLHKWREDAERLRAERDALKERVEAVEQVANDLCRMLSAILHPDPSEESTDA
jgi:hypothetical protein